MERILGELYRGKGRQTVWDYRSDLHSLAWALGLREREEAVLAVLEGRGARVQEIEQVWRARMEADGAARSTIVRRFRTLRSVLRIASALGFVDGVVAVAGRRPNL